MAWLHIVVAAAALLISWLAMHNHPNRLVRVHGVIDPH